MRYFKRIFIIIFLLSAFLPVDGFSQSSQSDNLVSLDYKNADLANILRSLAYSHDLNLVATKDLKGTVTISLKNVSIDEALEAILGVSGYAFTRKGNIIYVTVGPGLEGMDLKIEAISLNFLAADEASAILENLLSAKGEIKVNEATNSILVTDYPAFVDRIKKTLTEIDVPPIQVLIEARLIDITEKDFMNFGVTYSIDYKPEGIVKGLFDRQTHFQEEIAGEQTLAGPSSTLSGGQLKITAFTLKGLSATATIDALVQDQKAHLLASPSILTLNGKEARIIIGERYPYKEKTQTTTGTTETTKFVDIGTTLRVTPRVSPDGFITMNVHPEVSSLNSQLEAGPRIDTREADSTIRVRDGQTIVIGGLIKRQDDRTDGGIPYLKDIPIIGQAFSQKSSDLQATELVVFITPHIVKKPDMINDRVDVARGEDIFVEVERSGEQALLNTLWDEAQKFEKNEGIESRRKDDDWRLTEALDSYEQIASLYPDSELADDSLYRAGIISYTHFKDYAMAKRYFSLIVDTYPDSQYRRKAWEYVKKINWKEGYLEKKQERQDKWLEKQKQEELDKKKKEEAKKIENQKRLEEKKKKKKEEQLQKKLEAEKTDEKDQRTSKSTAAEDKRILEEVFGSW